ncbi:MAG: diguanylate cyclase [Clostridia bacterium]|nr:diguanylate cyclase [Clostridia bacterium]
MSSSSFYKIIIDISNTGYAVVKSIYDSDGAACDFEVLEVNGNFERILSLVSITGRTLSQIFAEREEICDWREFFRHSLQKGNYNLAQHFFPSLNIWCEITAKKLQDDRVVVVIKDISKLVRSINEKKSKQDELTFLNEHDRLTGLKNRKYIEEKIKQFETSGVSDLSLVIMDINGLKVINDAFGHDAGDRALKRVSSVIKRVYKDGIAARMGDDEFVILLPGYTCEDTAKVVRKAAQAISNENIGGINISVSCGWSAKDCGQSIMSALKKAEDFMNTHKLSEKQSARHNIINVIIKTLYEKSQREEIHSKRVAELCGRIGEALGLSPEESEQLRTAGLMHDIGKIAVSDETLNKAGGLTESEWRAIRRHPETGYKILSSVKDYLPLAEEVAQHHERWDGKGYPVGLKGEDIKYRARIIAIADAYDSMTYDRPYRNAMSKAQALSEVISNAGKQFDPHIARVFVEKVLNENWDIGNLIQA